MTDFVTPYPEYDVLQKRDSPSWDDATREVVRRRLQDVPPRRFFTQEEWQRLSAICERILPQPERGDERIAIVPWIDRQLDRDDGVGYRYADMPPHREAWRLGLRAIEDESQLCFEKSFEHLPADEQNGLLRAIQAGAVHSELWAGMPAQRFFHEILLRSVVSIYYAHPAAWSEIGYGGPASPRGYVRLGFDQRDPWEAAEHRG